MGLDAALPQGLWERIQSMIDTSVNKLLKSGLLRNASISEGGLTIRGGFLSLKAPGATRETFYVGGVSPNLPDGSQQPGLLISREDGSTAMALYDASPGSDYKQFLAIYDRAGNIIFGDDTDSGLGIARPWLPMPLYPRDTIGSQGRVATTSTSFTTLWAASVPRQQPKIYGQIILGTPVGATAEARLMVGGTQVGSTVTLAANQAQYFQFGPEAVPAGTYLLGMEVEVQARVSSGAGSISVAMHRMEGRQS